jgi:phospho-N-acetylmuramoyl-pentapeptide-transferase
MFGYFLLFCAAALLVFLVLNPLLRLLKFFSLSQNVRAEGPQLHLKKQGTLTFGGLSFVLVIFILAVIFIDLDIYVSLWALLGLMLAFAWVGFADDFLKQVKKQNEGLTVINKFLLQCLFAFLFVFFVLWQQGNVALWRWFFYLPFAGLVIVGSSNAANLTDGLDGLLSGVAAIILLTLAAIAFKVGREEIALFSVMAAGAVAGFLSYNFYPAKIFMGDVGSLAIGALFGGLAVLLNREW